MKAEINQIWSWQPHNPSYNRIICSIVPNQGPDPTHEWIAKCTAGSFMGLTENLEPTYSRDWKFQGYACFKCHQICNQQCVLNKGK